MRKHQKKSGDPSLGLEKQETSLGVSSEIKRGGRMSDELYFGDPNYRRHHSGPFFDPSYDEYNEHGPLDGESFDLDECPRRHPLNVENIRRMMRERNPNGN